MYKLKKQNVIIAQNLLSITNVIIFINLVIQQFYLKIMSVYSLDIIKNKL